MPKRTGIDEGGCGNKGGDVMKKYLLLTLVLFFTFTGCSRLMVGVTEKQLEVGDRYAAATTNIENFADEFVKRWDTESV